MLLICLSMVVLPTALKASVSIDTTAVPSVIQLAKVSKVSSTGKYWIVYHSPNDLIELENNGYTILKTKVKMIRNNQFWLSMWQSSLQMAVGYMIASKDSGGAVLTLPNTMNAPTNNFQKLKQY